MARTDSNVFRFCGAAVMGAVLVLSVAGDASAAARKKKSFISGITRTDQLPKQELRDARQRMVSNKRIPYRQMQALADHGDSLAALLIAKQLYEKPELSNDALHYFTMAASAGRAGAVKPLVALVHKAEPTTSNRKRLESAEAALKAHAARGDEAAFEGLMSAYRSGTPFDNSSEKYADFRAKAALRGNSVAALEEAISLMSLGDAATKKKEIEAYLVVAERAGDLKTQSVAGALRRKLASNDVTENHKSGDVDD